MGLVNRLPKLALIQAEGCAPMVTPSAKFARSSIALTLRASLIARRPASLRIYTGCSRNMGTFGPSPTKNIQSVAHPGKMEGLSIEPAAAAASCRAVLPLNMGVINRNETVVVCFRAHFPRGEVPSRKTG